MQMLKTSLRFAWLMLSVLSDPLQDYKTRAAMMSIPFAAGARYSTVHRSPRMGSGAIWRALAARQVV